MKNHVRIRIFALMYYSPTMFSDYVDHLIEAVVQYYVLRLIVSNDLETLQLLCVHVVFGQP